MNEAKKKLPLVILKSLEKFVALKGEKFNITEPGSYLLKVIEADNNPIFYFNIEQYKSMNGKYHFLMGRKPKDEKN